MINPFPLESPFSRFTSRLPFGNAKTKLYADGTTSTVVCRSAIFKKPMFEVINYTKFFCDNFSLIEEKESFKNYRGKYRMKMIKEYLGVSDISNVSLDDIKLAEKTIFIKKNKRKTGEPRPDSVKRAKDRIFDYTFNNKFDYFFTGTIDPEKLDSKDPKALLQPVQNWLKDRVKRDGFEYLLIAEHHKSGAIHFHGLIKCDKLDLVDSGTKSYRGYKKPMTDYKAIRTGLNPSDGKIVYNLKKWKFGFTTCIKCDGDRINVAYYVTKYITKDCKKLFGKFVWVGSEFTEADVIVEHMDYEEIQSKEFKGAFKYIFRRGEENRRIEAEKKRMVEYGDVCYDTIHGIMFNCETGEVYYDDMLDEFDPDEWETLLE